MAKAGITGELKASGAVRELQDELRFPLLPTLVTLIALGALSSFAMPWMGEWWMAPLMVMAGSFLGLELFYRRLFKRIEALRSAAEPDIKMISKMEPLLEELVRKGVLHTVHQSIHHLFSNRDVLRPRGGGKVDMVLDAADLPASLDAYLEDVKREGAEARILILDPSSTLIERHRLVMQTGEESEASVEHIRAKIQKAVDKLQTLATVRLYDAVPPGNLIIVDDHIFWGGLAGVPTDVALPILSLTADTREHTYWAFRRNFDVLWKNAKQAAPPKPAISSLTAASL